MPAAAVPLRVRACIAAGCDGEIAARIYTTYANGMSVRTHITLPVLSGLLSPRLGTSSCLRACMHTSHASLHGKQRSGRTGVDGVRWN